MAPSYLEAAATVVFQIPRILAIETSRYLLGTVPVFVLSWLGVHSRWKTRKIQQCPFAWPDVRRELSNSALSVVVYCLVALPGLVALKLGWISWSPPFYSALATMGFVILLLVAHDTWFYWTHRALHSRLLYKTVHRVHHRSTAPTAFAAYSFHFGEAVVQVGFAWLWIAIVPTPKLAMIIFLVVMIVRNAQGHSGFEVHPRGWVDWPITNLLTTSVHHDLHHSGAFGSNFGLYFTWWDRLMGTEHPSYREIFRSVTVRSPPDLRSAKRSKFGIEAGDKDPA